MQFGFYKPFCKDGLEKSHGPHSGLFHYYSLRLSNPRYQQSQASLELQENGTQWQSLEPEDKCRHLQAWLPNFSLTPPGLLAV